MFVRISKKKKLILLILIISTIVYFRGPDSSSDVTKLSMQQPVFFPGSSLPSQLNASTMLSIIPDSLPGGWQHPKTMKKDGFVTLIVDKPGNHIVTVTIRDKNTPELAAYAVTRENFTYPGGSVDWGEPIETKYNNVDAMKGTYIRDGTVMGELISYPHDRYLVTAYILGENDKIVDMRDILDSLEFPE